MTNTVVEIEKLPHYRDFTCRNCGKVQKVYILDIYGICENCGQKTKLRGFASMGTETEDVIDKVLQWIGSGHDFELAMKRKDEIDRFIANEKELAT